MNGFPNYVAPYYEASRPQSPQQQIYQAAQYFPQPQGSIYMINSSNDVANVPVGSGISAAVCMGEGILHLKTVQNGSPAIVSYRISPLGAAPQETHAQTQPQTQQTTQTAPTPQATPQATPAVSARSDLDTKILETLENIDKRLQKVEMFSPKPSEKPQGGNKEWHL